MKRLRDLMTPWSWGSYLLWRATRRKASIVVKLHDGSKLLMRPEPSTDIATAYEIFVDNAYQKPLRAPESAPELIVDLGANVGYSIIHFAKVYPNSRLLAFEPHPRHLSVLYRQLDINALQDRVRVKGSAASNKNADGFLTDNKNMSEVTETDEPGRIPIQIRDLFIEIGSERVDLLKMDIEGGEYAILDDPRFELLDVRMITMEWHNTSKITRGRDWCVERLSSLGFETEDGQLKYENAGMLWAWKS